MKSPFFALFRTVVFIWLPTSAVFGFSNACFLTISINVSACNDMAYVDCKYWDTYDGTRLYKFNLCQEKCRELGLTLAYNICPGDFTNIPDVPVKATKLWLQIFSKESSLFFLKPKRPPCVFSGCRFFKSNVFSGFFKT